MEFNRHQEVTEMNKTLKYIFSLENESLQNGNDTALMRFDLEVLEKIVDYWYNYREKVVFTEKNGLEIDEFLCVDEYEF